MLKYEDIIFQMGKAIAIYPLSIESIQGSSVDVLAGEFAWSIVTKKSVVEIQDEEKIVRIAPNDIIIVFSHEVISVDSTISGTVHAKLIWTTQGLFMNSTCIDPGYTGNFMFTIQNKGDKDIVFICGKTPIATLVFQTVGGKTKYQMKTKTLQLRALNSSGIVPGSDVSSELDAQWRNSAKDVRRMLKESAEYTQLQRMINETPRSVSRHLLTKWGIPFVFICIIVLVFLSNLPDAVKAAIPSVLALIALFMKR